MNDRLKIELKERDIYGFEKDIIRDNSDVFLKVDRVYKDENNKYIAEYDVAGFKSLTKIKRLNLAGYLKIEKAISELFLCGPVQRMRIFYRVTARGCKEHGCRGDRYAFVDYRYAVDRKSVV